MKHPEDIAPGAVWLDGFGFTFHIMVSGDPYDRSALCGVRVPTHIPRSCPLKENIPSAKACPKCVCIWKQNGGASV